MTPSQQSRADAIADAETLRTFLWQHYTRRYRPLIVASLSLEEFLSGGKTDRDALWPSAAGNLALTIASDAFSAVPGLRAS